MPQQGVPPATLAEFTLSGVNNLYYDVSLVDGYNLPMRIDNDKGCGVLECPVDLGPNLGCKSACEANLNGNPSNSADCSGSHNTPASYPASGVAYYSYSKNNCPNAPSPITHTDDGVTYTCTSALAADYTVTFCPPD
ncbi:hypothetical protein EW026_g2217 [Hermanssonia centrifuga]|uniref:Thaumatin-like protein n=1 Tax=Hermanssonia centrifuga TaxID=98765 RepID=A0A4S4KP20_9APHY|nr:hypothetical protein EW026_g2217 [Hermanssonia centrifuga]